MEVVLRSFSDRLLQSIPSISPSDRRLNGSRSFFRSLRYRRSRRHRSIAMSSVAPLASDRNEDLMKQEVIYESAAVPNAGIPAGLMPEILSEALVWSALHGLTVGDKNVQVVGLVLHLVFYVCILIFLVILGSRGKQCAGRLLKVERLYFDFSGDTRIEGETMFGDRLYFI